MRSLFLCPGGADTVRPVCTSSNLQKVLWNNSTDRPLCVASAL